MRHHLLVRFGVAALICTVFTSAAVAGAALPAAAAHATVVLADGQTDGIGILVIAIAALAASGSAGGKRGR